MHVDVVEHLRCPASHAPSPLVAAASEQLDRRISRGILGCPACDREFPITGGVADLRLTDTGLPLTPELPPPGEAQVVRLAAQLDLVEPERVVLLAGDYAVFAPALHVMFDARCVALGVSPPQEAELAGHASVLRTDGSVPLAEGYLHAAALDARHAAAAVGAMNALLRPRGRLVLPGGPPPGFTTLAADEREWVGARGGDVVPLRRAPR